MLAASAFVLFAYNRRLLSLIPFALALFCKESAIMIPAGLAVIAILEAIDRHPHATGGKIAALRGVIPHAALAGFFLALQFYLHNGWIYPSDKSAYRFTLGPERLYLKLKYLPWLLNLPADWFRQRWGMLPATALMLPPLIWLAIRVWRCRKREAIPLALCSAWAVAALLPAIPVAQVPMEHNLYIALMAAAVAMARCLSHEHPGHSTWWLAACFVAATAFHVRNDLKTSWVGEGSDITEASLQAVQRAYPVLPYGAQMFILPTTVPGGISWYFDDQALFRRVYNDSSLQVYYADLLRLPPAGFERRAGTLIFLYSRGRLFDVTADYKRAVLSAEPDSPAQDLLPGPAGVPSLAFSRASIEPGLTWLADDLVNGQAASVVPLAMGDSVRESLVELPQTVVRIPVDMPLPPGCELQIGVGSVGKLRNAAQGRMAWESGGQSQELMRVTLDPGPDAETWWDRVYDLSGLAGQHGTLLVENTGGRAAGWIAWNRLRIVPKSAQEPAVAAGGLPLARRAVSLIDLFSSARLEFDRQENYPNYAKFDSPTGKPAFLWRDCPACPSRASLVTMAGASLRYDFTSLPAPSYLSFGLAHGTGIGEGVEAHLYWEDAEGRQQIYYQMVSPKMRDWQDVVIALPRRAVSGGTLIIAASSGPRHNSIGAWLAWSRLRIVSVP